ncbi:MAG TPA: LCP family protein [Streptosporangiaceae bacterium]|jgi:LCP family protein required for cell wall assembly|nr:LCP family protein [Streptosporangiaceae bacterium]
MNDWPQGWYQDEPGSRGPARGSQGGQGGRGGQGGWGAPPAGSSRSAGSNWPQQPPSNAPGRRSEPDWGAPPGRPPSRTYQGGRRRRFWGQPGRRGRRIALVLGTVVVLIIALVAGSYVWLDGKLNRAVTLPASAETSAGTNWLITGSDTRSGLSRTQKAQLHVGSATDTNSDSLMLLHLGGPTPVLVSIPRDSYVEIPGHGMNKINAALGIGGPSLLVQTVENATGLTINHYMGIGFEGLVDVTNKVGGVYVCLKSSVQDKNSGVNLKAGCQTLNGTQALEFVRDRHSFATGDLQRIQDQRAFLKALLSKATSPGVFLNPFKALPFGSSAAGSISVDQGTHLYDLIKAGLGLKNPETGTVPIANANLQTSAGDSIEWDHTKATELFNALKNDQAVPTGLLDGTATG